MYNSGLYKRLHSEIGKIKLIDTHEHLEYPHELAGVGKIDFSRLFMMYAADDLVSAGMPVVDLENVREETVQSGWTPEEKWRALKPYYERTWNTAFCESLRIAIQDLYGIEDIRNDTIEPLSEKMNGIPRETWTRTVFDRGEIDIAMEQRPMAEPVYPRKRYPALFVYDMMDCFSDLSQANMAKLAEDTGIEIEDLNSYLKVIDWYFDKFADEATSFKIWRAYDRPLVFEEVPAPDASRLFNELLQFDDRISKNDVRAVEDFIVHYCIRKAEENNLPVKVHTGFQSGHGNDIRNSRAALMINLFTKYPNVKFDIYHISWPYTEELINISKNFPNVYIDFAWAWIINPPACRRFLVDMLETVPLNKIHGFGGDYFFVEGAYGHSIIARREIARVLVEKVEEGRFSEEFALRAAQRILRENAVENFRIEEKRKLFAERAQQE